MNAQVRKEGPGLGCRAESLERFYNVLYDLNRWEDNTNSIKGSDRAWLCAP